MGDTLRLAWAHHDHADPEVAITDGNFDLRYWHSASVAELRG